MNYCDGRPTAERRMDAVDQGIVLRHGDTFDAYGARDVFVWAYEGTYYMHYDAADPNVGWLCSLATSQDLVNWKKHGPILALGEGDDDDSKSASYGITYYEDDVWHMYYLGTPNVFNGDERVPGFPYNTLKAVSDAPNGPWKKQKEIVPFRPKANTYYSLTASPGQVLKHSNGYIQFFSATTQAGEQTKHDKSKPVFRTVSIARSERLDGHWIIDQEPMLPIEEQIENSAMYYEENSDTWFLFTNHIGVEESYGEYTDAIWVYWTKDLNKWHKDNKAIVLDNKNCLWSKKVIGLPSVLKVNNRLAIFYDGLLAEGTGHCHRDIGLAWLELPLSV